MNFKYVAFRNFFSVISDHWSWYFVLATTEDGRRSCWWLGRFGLWFFALTSTEDGRSRWGGSRGLALPRVWLANCMCHHLLWLLQSCSLLPGVACSEVEPLWTVVSPSIFTDILQVCRPPLQRASNSLSTGEVILWESTCNSYLV